METTTANKKWWHQQDGAQAGPLTETEMRALAYSGSVSGATLVWSEGMSAWSPLGTTELKSSLRQDVPPPAAQVDDPAKHWYNNSTKLWLSLLFWPLTVYGVYKTSLLVPKTKKIIAGVAVALLLLGAFSDGDDGTEVGMAGKPSWVSSWDHSVPSVERYIKRSMLDPGSYESVKWMLPVKTANGTWRVEHTYRGRNAFGGMAVATQYFIVSKDGEDVISVY
jgi:hypothetical protein